MLPVKYVGNLTPQNRRLLDICRIIILSRFVPFYVYIIMFLNKVALFLGEVLITIRHWKNTARIKWRGMSKAREAAQ